MICRDYWNVFNRLHLYSLGWTTANCLQKISQFRNFSECLWSRTISVTSKKVPYHEITQMSWWHFITVCRLSLFLNFAKFCRIYTSTFYFVGSVPRVSPPSGTVELNRTSSVNLTCFVNGQAGVHIEWYKNRRHIPAPLLSHVQRIRYGNGSMKSVLTLNRVKYKDRGSIISCSAWYPTLAINSTRNILLLVHGKQSVKDTHKFSWSVTRHYT